jgi:hypothetical protein
MGVGLGGADSSSLVSSASNSASFRMRSFSPWPSSFVNPLNVLLLLGLRESWCWTSILGTAMPDSSEPSTAMASLTRWPTTEEDKEEDELNYVPLPHLSSSSLLSPLSPPQSSSRGGGRPAVRHCDGRPLPRPLPPCPRRGQTNCSALFPIVPVPVPPLINPTIIPPVHPPLPTSPLPQ